MLSSPRAISPARSPSMVVGWKSLPSGVRYKDLVLGEGEQPARGSLVKVHYTGKIEASGEVFMASRGAGSLGKEEPFIFKVGSTAVVRGWDEGVQTMRVGGRRLLSIPAPLAYGEQGYLSGIAVRIPPNAKLLIDCELLGFSDGLEWTREIFRPENAGPWAILIITFAFLGIAAAPVDSIPQQVR
ncbi:MAG: hypothetical protein SGPRY_009767 [Prymnesium sp.]